MCLILAFSTFSNAGTILADEENKNIDGKSLDGIIESSKQSENPSIENEVTNKNTISKEENIQKTEQQAQSTEAPKEGNANSWRYSQGNWTPPAESIIKAKAAFTPWSKYNGQFLNSRGEVIAGATKKGIDISEHQGIINWNTVKYGSDIDYAIIRCGYGMDMTSQDDKQWVRNSSEAERVGMPYGVYLYSYANTIDKARSEAQHVLRLVRGKRLSYPIYYDMEDNIQLNGLTNQQRYEIAATFVNTIRAQGYEVQIYANLNWWNNYLNHPGFNQWGKWVAQYNYRCDYNSPYNMWQCTSQGTVPGINGNVDINFLMNGAKGDYWQDTDDGKYYYVNGVKFTGFRHINGNWYYFDPLKNGKMQTGWVTIGSTNYYFNDSGHRMHGSQKIDNIWYFFNTNGDMHKGWRDVDDTKVYHDNDGKMVYGDYTIDQVVYYFLENGKLASGLINRGGQDYWYSGGLKIVNGEAYHEGRWFYVGADGKTLVTGWIEHSNAKYYYKPVEGRTHGPQKIDEKHYYFGNDGKMLTNEHVAENGCWHYFTADGTMAEGFTEIGQNTFYYEMGTGAKVYGRKLINGKWYHFGHNGIMLKNEHVAENGYWHYYTANGTMAEGFTEIGQNTFYYAKESGAKLYGRQSIDGKWYHFGGNGIMLKNEHVAENGYWHYYTADGTMAEGLTQIGNNTFHYEEKTGAKTYGRKLLNGKWHHFGHNGIMLKNEHVAENGFWHYYAEDGAMAEGFTQIGNNTFYYAKGTGKKLYGRHLIDGKWYDFGHDGKLVK